MFVTEMWFPTTSPKSAIDVGLGQNRDVRLSMFFVAFQARQQ